MSIESTLFYGPTRAQDHAGVLTVTELTGLAEITKQPFVALPGYLP